MKKLGFLMALVCTFATFSTTKADVSVTYSTSYSAWERTWSNGYYTGDGYRYRPYRGYHSGSRVYIRETVIGTRTRVEVYRSSRYRTRVRTYYTRGRTIIGYHGPRYRYYNSRYYGSYNSFYVGYQLKFDTAADKIVSGTVIALHGASILADADSDGERILGAGLLVLGSASKAKGYEQQKAETALYKKLKELEGVSQDSDTDL